MRMWEEASDTGMKGEKKKDKNEERGRKEKIVNLTLEMIYLLTGEVAIRTHHVSIYFTLDEWDYITGNKDHYREGIKEDLLQLRPLDSECKDKRDITADLGGTLCYNKEPSKIRNDGKLTKHEMSPAEQPPPANGIKEEPTSWEGGNQSDCSINQHTEQIQGIDTPTPIMGCSLNNSLSEDSLSVVIKKEAASWEEGRKHLAEQRQKIDTSTVMGTSLNNNLFTKDTSDGIKEKLFLWETDHTYCKINTITGQILQTDQISHIIGCSLNNNSQGDYVSLVIKEEAASCEGGDQSDYSINPFGEQTQGTDNPTPNTGMYNCSECHECFTTEADLLRHQETHRGANPFVCSLCKKSFVCHSDLIVHVRSHIGEKPFSCSLCGKCFSWEVHLTEHYATHTREKPYSCSECGKCFTRRWNLAQHSRSHTGQKRFCCSVCGKDFSYHSQMKSHYRTHTGEKPYICSECGKSFKDGSGLRIHQKYHTGVKPFSCSECGKCFTRRSGLTAHIRVHTGERPFPCSECGKCFTCQTDLARHLRIHTGEKPYTCTECGKGYIGRTDLARHIRIHTGEKPYSCTECGKCYVGRTDLNRHLRIHTGEKPFTCSECGKCFIFCTDLNRHLKSHTKKKPFTSSPCHSDLDRQHCLPR
ncbi:oocyte zinc finger protein XlCOF7.1-like isoform X2 [Xenopus laevis]|uniref:Oocyte zinc finger protein XlCOF7.1-like isoform X2 n=1 Tax=Xenopus laevis TaxID=8355 RepID=A0A8J1M0X3_XENLA|nr:oocyte zinc finger protein XlCOF7.1-like isoform X2 [Xenopus laevis]